jgi:uncharacterized protein
MSLLTQIEQDLKAALLNRDDDKLRTLRMVKSDIMYEKTKGTEELDDNRILEIILRASKKRKEAIDEYRKAGRNDLAEKEMQEFNIIEQYLPKQLSEEEINVKLNDFIKSLGDVTKNDFGKIMSQFMKENKGKADGAIVKKLLTNLLEKL